MLKSQCDVLKSNAGTNYREEGMIRYPCMEEDGRRQTQWPPLTAAVASR